MLIDTISIDVNSWTSWKKLQNGQLVSFEIGSNAMGECAKNIKLVSVAENN